mmetsp:Transcript_89595/g.277117  ORF Transcript_89595/g.277117 Transcript_89595/m.277117 type:complete len:205 (-) Transcript_89595:240-854(-)
MEVLHLCIAKTGGGAGTCGENMLTTGSFRTAKGDEYMLCETTLGFTFLVRDGDLACSVLVPGAAAPCCGEPARGAEAAGSGPGAFAAAGIAPGGWPGIPKAMDAATEDMPACGEFVAAKDLPVMRGPATFTEAPEGNAGTAPSGVDGPDVGGGTVPRFGWLVGGGGTPEPERSICERDLEGTRSSTGSLAGGGSTAGGGAVGVA